MSEEEPKKLTSSELTSKRNRERVWTPEMRAKVAASVAAYAATHPDTPETREKKGAWKKGIAHTPEHRRKISEAKKGKPRPDMQTGGKNAHNRFTGPWTEEMRAAKSAATIGIIPIGYKRFWEEATEEEKKAVRLKQALASKNSWNNKSQEEKDLWVSNTLRAVNMRPNKAEAVLQEILDSVYPDCYVYVGGGELVLGHKCPDFAYLEQHKLIEFFGSYWHVGHDPQKRIDHFRKFGYETLVIWDYEMQDPDLMDRVIAFTSGILPT